MTMEHAAPTWREAMDIAWAELASGPYYGWGWARVWRCTPDKCGRSNCDRAWVASIA